MSQPDGKIHLTFGGSSAHRWLACPGSVNLCATLPPQQENEHMAAGTRAHALLELAVTERRDSVLDFEGVSLKPGWPEFTLEDVEAVQVAVDHVNGILERHPDAILWVERQFTLGEDVGGTADVVIYVPSQQLLVVIDYKHGRGMYVPEGTPQMRLYAACVLFGLPDLLVARIDATIIQPRCQAGTPIRTAVYSPGDLINFSDEVEEAVARARSDDPPFAPGREQCHWCPAAEAGACKALYEGTIAVTEIADWSDTQGVVPAGAEDNVVLTLPSPERLRASPDALFETLKALPVMKAWIDGIEKAAEDHARGTGYSPGFKFVDKVARRKWIDEAAAREYFATKTMFDEDEYAPRKLLSVAQAEKLVKSEGKDAVKAMAEHVVKESSGTKLVLEDAKGDAVNPLQRLADMSPLPEA